MLYPWSVSAWTTYLLLLHDCASFAVSCKNWSIWSAQIPHFNSLNLKKKEEKKQTNINPTLVCYSFLMWMLLFSETAGCLDGQGGCIVFYVLKNRKDILVLFWSQKESASKFHWIKNNERHGGERAGWFCQSVSLCCICLCPSLPRKCN